MKLNNNGFAISGMLYASLILFLALLLGVLSIMASRKIILDKQKTEIVNKLSGVDNPNCGVQICNADISGAAIPEMTEGMIPITWDGARWIKADKHNREGDNQWYDYENKKWANVALVSEETRAFYLNASIGVEILDDDVSSYFVWVPRYRYKLFNASALSSVPQSIEIIFEDRYTSKSSGKNDSQYLTHPAFTYGERELNGLWIGKFETTGSEQLPTIKPNSTSLRNNNIKTQSDIADKFNSTTYGIDEEYTARMMKNTEWGMVAYLSHSIYGKNEEIWNNPSATFTTGCAGSSKDASNVAMCTNAYSSENGVQASTTGNIYGIYDMAGGASENVIGAMYNSDNATIMIGNTGFEQANIDSPEMRKLINKYSYGTTASDQNSYNRRKLGDATGETRGWYGDARNFVSSSNSWFVRGGNSLNTTTAGIFNFEASNGYQNNNNGFRVVISNKHAKNIIPEEINDDIPSDTIIIDHESDPALTFELVSTNSWVEGQNYRYQYSLRVSNIGTVDLNNFNLEIKYDNPVSNPTVWNYEVETIDSTTILVKNVSTVLKTNKSLDVGLQITSPSQNLKISKVKMVSIVDMPEVTLEQFNVKFNVTGSWGNFTNQYDVVVTNKMGKKVNAWEVEITLPEHTTYVSGWNGVFQTNGNILTVKNETWNGVLTNNKSANFGLQLNSAIQNFIPTNIKVRVIN
jgi:hypothetical protein